MRNFDTADFLHRFSGLKIVHTQENYCLSLFQKPFKSKIERRRSMRQSLQQITFVVQHMSIAVRQNCHITYKKF